MTESIRAMNSIQENPFAVQTPEDLTAEKVFSLFVDVFSDFHNVPKQGHTFLHGPRGSGKSMMFRFLEPDCQLIATQKRLHDLEFFGVLVPLKTTDLNVIEFSRLEETQADVVLNEHWMTVSFAARLLSAFTKIPTSEEAEHAAATRALYAEKFVPLVRDSGFESEIPALSGDASVSDSFKLMTDVCHRLHRQVSRHLRLLAFAETPPPYKGALTGYLDFFVPIVQALKELPFMPRGPVYLMIDDADNLSTTQTRILNSWVSFRTGADVSLKISTQLAYKTYLTTSGGRIDSPHDYSEVNIATVYTSNVAKYRDRVRRIVSRRLESSGISAKPGDFFPQHRAQERKIQVIASQLLREFDEKGRGARASDDVLRYARPMYIASLKGTTKAGSKYSYSGFNQLVHLSDGVIRHFLEPASLMFGQSVSQNPSSPVAAIPHGIQNRVARDVAERFKGEIEKLAQDYPQDAENFRKLRRLVDSLGGLFHQILISERSERRVFSIAFSDQPDRQVEEILRLGRRHGYFQRSSIGNKDGTGRTDLHILSRRLAPLYLLDPTSFAGYLFVTNRFIIDAIANPQSLLRRAKRFVTGELVDPDQGVLFGETP